MNNKNINWVKLIGVGGMILSGLSMICSNISQKNEIKEAASNAAKEAVNEMLKNQ